MVRGKRRRCDRYGQQGIGHIGGVEADHSFAVHTVGGEQAVAEYGQSRVAAAFVHALTHRSERAVYQLIDLQVFGRSTIGCGQQEGGIRAEGQAGFVGGAVQLGEIVPGVAVQLLQHRGLAAQGSQQTVAAGGQIIGAGTARAGQAGEAAILRLIDQQLVVVGHILESQIHLALAGHCDLRIVEHPAGGTVALPHQTAFGDGGIACLGIAAGHIGQMQGPALGGKRVVVHIRQQAKAFPCAICQHGQVQCAVAGAPCDHRGVAQAGQSHPIEAARLSERLRGYRGPAGVSKGVELQLITGIGQIVADGHDLAADRPLGQRCAGVSGELGILPQGLRICLGNGDREGHGFVLGRGDIRNHDAGIGAIREGERTLGQPGIRVRTADGGAAALGREESVAHGGPLAALHIAVLAGLGAEYVHAGGAEVVAQAVHRGVHPVDDEAGAADAGVQSIVAVGGGLAAHLHHKQLIGIALRADHIGLVAGFAGGADGNVPGRAGQFGKLGPAGEMRAQIGQRPAQIPGGKGHDIPGPHRDRAVPGVQVRVAQGVQEFMADHAGAVRLGGVQQTVGVQHVVIGHLFAAVLQAGGQGVLMRVQRGRRTGGVVRLAQQHHTQVVDAAVTVVVQSLTLQRGELPHQLGENRGVNAAGLSLLDGERQFAGGKGLAIPLREDVVYPELTTGDGVHVLAEGAALFAVVKLHQRLGTAFVRLGGRGVEIVLIWLVAEIGEKYHVGKLPGRLAFCPGRQKKAAGRRHAKH